MKAAFYSKYGSPDVISIKEVEKPRPGAGEVLVRVRAASVNAYDWRLICAKPFFTRLLGGVFKPKDNIPGADVAGVVEAAGEGAALFQPGDEVFGCLEGCGAGGLATGGFAEYVCAKESVLAPKLPALSFAEAAALPMASVTALQAVRDDAKVQPGQSVLINGASGGVGTFAVQIAKALGAQVTAVCGAGAVDVVRSLGADCVIDYSKEDVASSGKQFDAVIDVAATLSVKDYRRLLKPNGTCVAVGFSSIRHLLSHSLAGTRDGKRITLCKANNKVADPLLGINELIQAGQLRAVIDSHYPLEEAAEAIRRAAAGHPKGKVVIEMQELTSDLVAIEYL